MALLECQTLSTSGLSMAGTLFVRKVGAQGLLGARCSFVHLLDLLVLGMTHKPRHCHPSVAYAVIQVAELEFEVTSI